MPQGDSPLSPTGLSPSMARLSSLLRLKVSFVTPRPVRGPARTCPSTPPLQRPRASTQRRFRLLPFRSPLLRESRLLSSPPGTEMFQFPGCRLIGVLDSPNDDRGSPLPGFPIRASRDQRPLAPPPGLSQLATPFIASWRQGIHQTPLVT